VTTFWLGTHMPSWLATAGVPLFVSHRRLAGRKTLPRAIAPWALDSGGFSELAMYGEWRTSPAQYATAVRRYSDEIGSLAWAAPQDLMCEPFMLAKTGMTVAEHQHLTRVNGQVLRDLAPDLPWIWVLQGWTLDDYRRHRDAYAAAGIDLTTEPLVGIGSVCRRQGTGEIGAIVSALACDGISLHGFGVKTLGLASYSAYLSSADSMAWSSRGRRVAGCRPSHKTEANCMTFARSWRRRVLDVLAAPVQLDLFAGVGAA
jgi:hypothetical protein